MAHSANNTKPVVSTTTAPSRDPMQWYGRKAVEDTISSARKSIAVGIAAASSAFRDAIGHALVHGNAELVTTAYPLLTDPATKAVAIQMVKNMNKTMLPSNKIAGGIAADWLVFSVKDGFAVKPDRMKARNHFLMDTEAATAEHLEKLWSEAIATLKAVKDENSSKEKATKSSPEFIKAALSRLVRQIGETYSPEDGFANVAYKELQAIVQRAETLLKETAKTA